ncbi:MAG: hypothetical protein E7675_07030 [Ruminococcaceae bacterium]|nr:hypothetical protein [Oscillospiraceae bacterium]
MENSFFSLIYKNKKQQELISFSSVNNAVKQLDASWLLCSHKNNWLNYITDDIETIQYREEAFADIMKCPELSELCNQCIEKLSAIDSLKRLKEGQKTNETMLYSIKEVELYIDFIDLLYISLSKIHDSIQSEAFKNLYDRVLKEINSREYIALKEGVSVLSHKISGIKSLTVGINLDANLTPYESGIVSVNEDYFHSGDLISRFMRLEKKDEMTTLAPLYITQKLFTSRESDALNISVNDALKKIVSSGLRGWDSMLKKYFNMNTAPWLNLYPEFLYLSIGSEIIRKLKQYNLPLCTPIAKSKEEKCFLAKGLYNPALAEKIKSKDSSANIIDNDFSFDKDGMIYILTGPNRGGKSVVLCAVGIAQIMFQLGLPVAAKSAEISPVDCIYTHFATFSDSTIGKGRLGEECDRLKDMFASLNKYSLVLMDETLSSTDSYEASVIGYELLAAMSSFGCRGIFATHIHELAFKKDDLNSLPSCNSRIDTLVAGINNGKRTYKIIRTAPDGKSYARDIAQRYGLSFESLVNNKNN